MCIRNHLLLVALVVCLPWNLLHAQTDVNEKELAEKHVSESVAELFRMMHDGEFGKHYSVISPPKLDWTDIPSLLAKAESSESLASFPIHTLSSQSQSDCSEGVVALWLIESIRSQGEYPSLNPMFHCLDKNDPLKGKEMHQAALEAYQNWWSSISESVDLDDDEAVSKAIESTNPLKDKNICWYGAVNRC